MKNNNLLLIAAVIGVGYFLFKKKTDKRKWLVDYFTNTSVHLGLARIVDTMAEADVNMLYDFIQQGAKAAPALQQSVMALQTKYNFSFS